MAVGRRLVALAVLVALSAGSAGCAGRWSYRQGRAAMERGDWDVAVARLTRALEKNPRNIAYKIALENARVQASRAHYAEARKHLAAQDLAKAADELEIASKYDPSNKAAIDDLEIVRGRVDKLAREARERENLDAVRARAQARLPVAVLSARSTVPIALRWADQSLEKLYETIGKLAGVNILFDADFRDKKVTVNLTGVSFQEALDQISFVHRLFYKVLDPNTLIIVPDTPAKRRSYEDALLRTFYLTNADVKEVEPIVKATVGANLKATSNASLNAITVVGTVDELAVAERIIELNDKPRGEVMAEVQILEINRTSLKRYGLELSNYEGQVTFSPFGSSGEVANGFTNLRAHLLSSFNQSDWVVTIPSSLFARFLQTESTVKIIANPRLRAAEGKPTSLRIGTEVPIPVTTFTATSPGTTTFAPATNFQYRNVGVNLKLTPRVTPAGEIALEINAEFSLLGENQNVGTGQNPLIVPTFLTRNVDGVLRLRDGETSLIGGLLQARDTGSFRGALGLQSVPILNKIFTSTQKQVEDSEIVISITPHIVRGPKLVDEDLESMLVGTAERFRVTRPLLPSEPLPPASPAPGGSGTPVASPTPPVSAPPAGLARPGAPEPSLPRPGAPSGPGPEPLASPVGPPLSTPVIPTPVPLASPSPFVPLASPAPLGSPAPFPGGAGPSPAPGPVVTNGPSTGAPDASAGTLPLTAVLNPAEARVRVGDTVSLTLVVLNARGLTDVQLAVAYDREAVEATEAVSGPLLTLSGATVAAEKTVDPGRLRARFRPSIPAGGSGVAAVLTMRGVRPGSHTVAVDSLVVRTAQGEQRVSVAPARLEVTR